MTLESRAATFHNPEAKTNRSGRWQELPHDISGRQRGKNAILTRFFRKGDIKNTYRDHSFADRRVSYSHKNAQKPCEHSEINNFQQQAGSSSGLAAKLELTGNHAAILFFDHVLEIYIYFFVIKQ